ncbi:hypothetical protein BJ742DRAFT_767238 [Cladochytrium replicatum]|nr:hypothetical protein BJ742DRAFT_767238 [Cladochytrium replicatum]
MGKLNILQHKSWHVYSEKNREKVRRDEEEARKKEQKEKDRAIEVESDLRLQKLRAKKGNASSPTEPKPPPEDDETQSKQEKPAQQGFALGGELNGEQRTPWYASRDGKKRKVEQANDASIEADQILKEKEDPMSAFSKYSTKRHKLEPSHVITQKSGAPSSVKSEKSKSEADLRDERLKREQQERLRAEALIAKMRGVKSSQDQIRIRQASDRTYYNSQFNPHLVKKPRE